MSRHFRTVATWGLVAAFAVMTPTTEARAQGTGDAGQTNTGGNGGFNDWGLLGLLGLAGLANRGRDDHARRT